MTRRNDSMVLLGPALVIWCLLHSAPSTAQTCATALVCLPPSEGESCVSGQLYDFATGALLRAANPTGEPCPQVTADGPCSVELQAHDVLLLFQNPSGSAPLPSDVGIDDCGRYLIADFSTPLLGFLALTTDDASPIDYLVPAASAVRIAPGDRLDGVPLYAVETSTDQAWTTSAGDPFTGSTFSEQGVFVAVFFNGGAPARGTYLTRDPDGIFVSDDYYFDDLNPLVRLTVDPALDSTGANGAAMMTNSVIQEHSGTGGEAPGCVWPSHLGKSAPGLVVVQEFHSIDPSTGDLCTSPSLFADGFESGSTSEWTLTAPHTADFHCAPTRSAIGEVQH